MSFQYFSLGLVEGSFFCPRPQEQAWIEQQLTQEAPSLLISPSRQGKTSLILHMLKQQQMLYAMVDLFMINNLTQLLVSIQKGLGRLIPILLPHPEQVLTLIKEFLPEQHVGLAYDEQGLFVELTAVLKSPLENIIDMFVAVDRLAQLMDKRTVIFLDGCQQFEFLPQRIEIETALYQCITQSKNIHYILASNNRESSGRLYDMCERRLLERMSESDYTPFLQNLAETRWGSKLPQGVLDKIFYYSKCHPYYINILCSRLWQQDMPPSVTHVVSVWHNYVVEERGRVANDLEGLSHNQRRLLIEIAHAHQLSEPTGKNFLNKIGMSGASVMQALNVLLARGWVWQNSLGFLEELDPLVGMVCRRSFL